MIRSSLALGAIAKRLLTGGRTAPARLIRRRVATLLLVTLALPVMMAGRAAAQETVGGELCGTPIAAFINSTVPLVVAFVIIVGTVFAFLMHVRAGIARDAVPVVGVLLERVLPTVNVRRTLAMRVDDHVGQFEDVGQAASMVAVVVGEHYPTDVGPLGFHRLEIGRYPVGGAGVADVDEQDARRRLDGCRIDR